MSCRYCNQPIESEGLETFSYWNAVPFRCHPECKQAGEKQEALDCQVIDADCNDCKHFKRGALSPLRISHTKTPAGRMVEVRYRAEIWSGECLRFNGPTEAYPKMSTGRECFEHRRI